MAEFSGKRLSPRERREAHRHAEARARARAAAIEAARVSNPGAPRARAVAPPASSVPPRLAPAPQPTWGGQPSAARSAPRDSGGSSLPMVPSPVVAPFGAVPTTMAGALPRTPVAHRGPVGGALDAAEAASASLGRRLRGSWGARASITGVLLGAALTVAGVFAGLGVGGPVLGHPARPVVLLAGLAGVGAGLLWVAKGWASCRRAVRRSSAGVALALVATFTVGTLTNPVVVDGQVFLSTSPQARSYHLIQQLRSDLLELARSDTYLTYDAAQAGAHYDDYTPLLNRMTALSDKYAALTDNAASWPDKRFATVLEQTKSASYWAARAVTSKVQVIDQDNAKSESDLASNRASYAQSVIDAGTSLRELAAELNLPLTQMGPTE